MNDDPKIIAFVLPQFHVIPENDEWWGKGFTEWTNVRKATSQFKGHRQPRVPLAGNYYDLLDPSVQEWQATLARSHGVYGFCYYHYWFGGKLLLERPLAGILERQAPDFPFCLAWANEPWTRAWDGGDKHVLVSQNYGAEAEWEAHYMYLEKVFKDPRYIKIDNKPVLLIYRSTNVEGCEERLAYWRKLAVAGGFDGLHIVSMMTFFGKDPREHIFDAYAAFEPNHTQRNMPTATKWLAKGENFVSRCIWDIFGKGLRAPKSYDYRSIWSIIANRPLEKNHYPGAFVDWDNSPRKNINSSMVMRNVSVSIFKTYLRKLFARARNAGTPFIFVNAWNEWAEGTYLEPDQENGTAYLEAVKAVVVESRDAVKSATAAMETKSHPECSANR